MPLEPYDDAELPEDFQAWIATRLLPYVNSDLGVYLDEIGSTRGSILYRGASGWAILAPGTAAYVLTSNGAGADPSYAVIPAASPSPGITTILAPTSLPAAATYDITGIAETYAYLVLRLDGVSSTVATRQPLVRVSTDNGASFDATVGNYEGNSSGGGATTLASLIESANGAAADTFNAQVILRPYHTGVNAMYHAGIRLSSSATNHITFGTYIGSTDNIDALRILWNGSGNFDAGTVALYGVA